MELDPPESRGVKRKADESVERPRRIRALDQDVVNKIAAGEIIVAPVHALKELVENAVDAGATSLEILAKDGGLKLLQITDNGHGINRDDLPILCERFTTSKLQDFEDLTSIGTYGFRGEALASISHIAHLQITTKTQESSSAWRAHYAAGKLVAPKPGQSEQPKPCAGRQGTQITVEDLFYNVPTRRKAFRSASDEYHKIVDLVSRYAVHCDGVAFSCKKHGAASVDVTVQAAATTIDRIRTIYGSPVANDLLQFQTADETYGFRAKGWISNASFGAKKTSLLLFINNRSVESSNIKRSVEQAYTAFLSKGSHPFIYLSLEIDPARVDVNVHPTKREVNFLNEDEIIEKICEEICARLGNLQDSRSYQTQSLLPGVKIPTISAGASTAAEESESPPSPPSATPHPSRTRAPQRTPASSKPYENNLVRTDSKLRTITSMFPSLQRSASTPAKLSREQSSKQQESEKEASADAPDSAEDPMDYEYTEREYTICRLQSVKELRATVRENMHNGLTDVFATHTWVGIIDESKRLVAIQSGVKLFLVDYGMVCNEFFYQLGLTDFANFGIHRFDPPLDLRELLRIGAEAEKSLCSDEEAQSTDWNDVVDFCLETLVSRRDMLLEYFSIEISDDKELVSLPLLIKGYTPSLAKMPRFLIRLGPMVDWSEEKRCFHSLLRELAAWYAPEVTEPPANPNGEGDAMDEESDETASRRVDLHRALEHVLFPTLKSRLVATKGMLKGVLEIANLKGLYRVFERC